MNYRTKLMIIGAVSSVVVCSPYAFCTNIINAGEDASFRGMILLTPFEFAIGAVIGLVGSYTNSSVFWVVVGALIGAVGGEVGVVFINMYVSLSLPAPVYWAAIVIIGSMIGAIPLVVAGAFKHATKVERFEP